MAKNSAIDKKFLEFAIHLFRCIPSSASIERIFSNFSFIQNKLRNRLGIDKASKLVMAYKMLNSQANEKGTADEW